MLTVSDQNVDRYTDERKWLNEKLRAAAIGGVPFYGVDKAGRSVELARVWTESVLVDPNLANFLLEERNVKSAKDKNRPFKSGKILNYQSDMSAGLWMPDTGETIKISKDGWLNDGQNRLKAIAELGHPMYLVFQFGLRRETMATLDGGAGRTAADDAARKGWDYPTTRQRHARLWAQFDNKFGLVTGRAPIKSTLQLIMTKHRKRFDDALADLPKARMAHYPLALAVFTLDVLRQFTDDTAATTAFMVAFLTGENLSANSPIYQARQYVMNQVVGKKASPYEKDKMNFKCVVYAWNKWRAGAVVSTWRVPAAFPTPISE